MTSHLRTSSLLCALLCAACSSLAPTASPTKEPSRESATINTQPLMNELLSSESLLDYAGAQRGRSNTELGEELERLNKAYATRPSEFTRLRLAVFLATQASPNGDRSRALNLLDVPASDANGRGRHHPLASLLIGLLQEARRSDDNLATAHQKLRDEQKRADGLQQKLDALRDIDRNIDRKTLGRPPAPR